MKHWTVPYMRSKVRICDSRYVKGAEEIAPSIEKCDCTKCSKMLGRWYA